MVGGCTVWYGSVLCVRAVYCLPWWNTVCQIGVLCVRVMHCVMGGVLCGRALSIVVGQCTLC